MSKLDAFLNPAKEAIETKDIIVSRRFQDKDGNPVPFTIQSILQTENDKLIQSCTRRGKKGERDRFDSMQYNRKLVLACTVFPDFSNAELCKKYGVIDPEETPGAMLMTGEYAALLKAIEQTNGFEDADLEEEAKNS